MTLRARGFSVYLFAGLLFLSPTVAGAADESRAAPRTIAISATGTVTAQPDQVAISIGVSSSGKTAKAALAANSGAMRPVIAALKAAGIEDRDVQTSNFSIQPTYEYSQDGKPPKFTGYQAANTVNVRLRTISKLSDILDIVVGEGSNQIGGIQFVVSKADELRDDARKAAVADATRMAKAYAAAAGVELGPVQSIAEASGAPEPRPGRVLMQARANDSAAPPIEAGEETLTVQVTMVWEIK